MKLLTLARDLRRRKARDRQGLFVVEGVRAVEELLRSPLAVRGALVAPQLLDAPRGIALRAALDAARVDVAEVTTRDFASAAETESPQGILAVAAVPERSLDTLLLTDPARLLVLDAVQDPGNVGTILRTAAALGAAATVALPGTVDVWNAKVVRSAMGAHFRHPAFHCTWEALDAFRAERGVALWAADAAGTALGDLDAPPRLALVVGNEGAGVSAEARARAAAIAALPMVGAESLNVAVAAGIFLYQLRP
ncbi:MAG TPA: RNA methyltransferase [Gemmatimonadaceae bacterium]|nr:RNA methyltransferase [Gemmatimonadaceae bacterium]